MPSSRLRVCALGSVLVASLILSGCVALGPPVTYAQLRTPLDPPLPPRRKPPPPNNFAALASAVDANQPAAQPIAAARQPASYRVRKIDNVHSIARRFGIPIRSLIDVNGLKPPYTLLVGQRLRIPRSRVHRVTDGETVYGISRRYGADMAELMRLNRIAAPYRIVRGQALMLPQGRTPAPATSAPLLAQRPTTAQASIQPAPRQGTSLANVVATAPRVAPRLNKPRAAIPQPPALKGGKFLWPVTGKLLSGFGPKPGGLHNDGMNIASPRGAAIRAAENGVVVYAGNELGGFGNLLLIKHRNGWVTAYAHAQDLLVRRGEAVRRGQTIATVGSTGNVSQPQLHFEVRKGTRAIDPTQVLGSPMTAAAG